MRLTVGDYSPNALLCKLVLAALAELPWSFRGSGAREGRPRDAWCAAMVPLTEDIVKIAADRIMWNDSLPS